MMRPGDFGGSCCAVDGVTLSAASENLKWELPTPPPPPRRRVRGEAAAEGSCRGVRGEGHGDEEIGLKLEDLH